MILSITMMIIFSIWVYFKISDRAENREAIEAEQKWLHEQISDLRRDTRALEDRHGNHLNQHELKIHLLERQIKPVTGEKKILREKIAKELSASVRVNMGH